MALQKLGEHVSFAIETKELKKLIDIANKYGGGKSSGAGGGDCGIALVKTMDCLKRLPMNGRSQAFSFVTTNF